MKTGTAWIAGIAMLEQAALQIRQALQRPQLRQPALVERAMGRQALALLATLNTECASADQLGEAATEAFQHHPDHAIVTSSPGLGEMTAACLFTEIGDDRDRFTDARGLKAFAGSAPVTRASGRSLSLTHRRTKNHRRTTNHRLAAVGFVWAFAATPRPDPAREHYLRRRDHGDRHATTPPGRATCSTTYFAASTTANKPAKPTTKPRPSPPTQPHHNLPQLDSYVERRDLSANGVFGPTHRTEVR
jgi:transposase